MAKPDEEKNNVEDFDPLAPTSPQDETAEAAEGESDETAEVDPIQDELNRTKEHLLRALADAENTRRRAVKEREDASKYAISKFAKDLLGVADNLRRAIDATPPELLEKEPQVKNLIDGIEATERELLKAFDKNGIEKVDPIDQKFDPNFHEVMFEAPVPEKEEGTVMQVMEVGYTIQGRILRPARVGVTKKA